MGPNSPNEATPCKCGRTAVTFLRYSGAHLCADCFKQSVVQRVRREVRTQVDLKRGTKLAVAVSGGKDSLVTLRLVEELASERREVELMAITVDEGIAGYRTPSVEAAANVCAQLGVEHRITKLADASLTRVDEIAALEPSKSPCSYCGVFRRRAMNAEARAWGADYLATGHNLDDVAQSILMSFVRGDLGKLARMAPHDKPQEGLVPRILPLRQIPEKEVFLFALLEGLPISPQQCPHMGRAARGEIKDMLLALEDSHPGTRHTLVAVHDRLRPALRETLSKQWTPIGLCPRCGQPSVSGVCQSCLLVDELEIERAAHAGAGTS
jgi:uncharacterized protein (TIGR00269 family)